MKKILALCDESAPEQLAQLREACPEMSEAQLELVLERMRAEARYEMIKQSYWNGFLCGVAACSSIWFVAAFVDMWVF